MKEQIFGIMTGLLIFILLVCNVSISDDYSYNFNYEEYAMKKEIVPVNCKGSWDTDSIKNINVGKVYFSYYVNRTEYATISGNLSWIKEYYKEDREFAGYVYITRKENLILKDEITIENFVFDKYGEWGSVDYDSTMLNLYSKQDYYLLHSHPINVEISCAFSDADLNNRENNLMLLCYYNETSGKANLLISPKYSCTRMYEVTIK